MRSHQNKHHHRTTGRKQRGVAIITALLIVTIAATVSITISTQLQLDVRRTGNLIALDQADLYALQVEKFTQEILQDPDIFSGVMTELRELGKVEKIFPVGNATVQGEITDLNSCINLNTLINPSLPAPSIDPLVRARLTRLFDNARPPIPTSMIPAIIDWIDEDADTTIPDGGEDGHYLNLEQPYRAANQPLSSITELRLIKDAENLQAATPRDRYSPYNNILALAVPSTSSPDHFPSLCAFNTIAGSSSQINVNTASRDVLMSLSQTMTATIADAIIACRGPAPNGAEFTNITDFFSCSNDVNTAITAADRGQLTVSSDYFLLKTKVSLGDAKKITYSIIFRNPAGGTSQIISRTQRTL